MNSNGPEQADPQEMRVVERNIRALLVRKRLENQQKSFQNRIADRITRFTGSMVCVYMHLVVFGAWIAINTGLVPGVPRFDPSLVVLAMAASVEAIFLSTFVLITQNRMAEQAAKRADLDLQISLLAEHEITRVIMLVRAIASKMGIKESNDPELAELVKDVQPERVLDKIEENAADGK
ncbi:MAG TPA: DUF1003 domain-containing protein [Verrucomicrobiae bacterium]|nr:DUF1003 domain-containing protein [Verrucomicrobiae bacterium]